MRTLCICVDDFGLDIGINRAVVELAEHGKISATSLMVKRSAAKDACRLLKGISPSILSVGLHLDMGGLAGGRTGSSEILHDGRLSGFVVSNYLGLVGSEKIRREVHDQLSCFEDLTGCAPAFIDGHQHVHQLPGVRQILIEEIAARYTSRLPWMRSTKPCRTAPLQGKAELIYGLGGRSFDRLAAQYDIQTNRHLLGVYAFKGDITLHRQRMTKWLLHSRSGDVLMCHPSVGSNSLDPHDRARRIEFSVLRYLDLADPDVGPPISLIAGV